MGKYFVMVLLLMLSAVSVDAVQGYDVVDVINGATL